MNSEGRPQSIHELGVVLELASWPYRLKNVFPQRVGKSWLASYQKQAHHKTHIKILKISKISIAELVPRALVMRFSVVFLLAPTVYQLVTMMLIMEKHSRYASLYVRILFKHLKMLILLWGPPALRQRLNLAQRAMTQ